MKTFALALIGQPVKQSKSDTYHQYFLSKMKVPGTYEKVEIAAHQLKEFIQFAKEHYTGLSVTMPLKECICPFLDTIDERALQIGAVNTIRFRNGEAIGFNTDGIGAINAIRHFSSLPLRGRHAVIVGAGGAAKAIAWELTQMGVTLTIVNRNLLKAKQLANQLHVKYAPLHALDECLKAECDILIQATCLGMQDNQQIIAPAKVPSHVITLDVVSSSKNQWLTQLSEQGVVTIPGKFMWIFQAVEQYKIWFDSFKKIPSQDLLNVLLQAWAQPEPELC